MNLKIYKPLLLFMMCLWWGTQTFAQDKQVQVTGLVTSAKGEPMPGVSVTVKGTSVGSVTDVAGKFSIKAPGKQSVLLFTFLGFLPKNVTVGDNTSFKIVLDEDLRNLNEVVVTALGIKRESKRLGYSTASVNTEQLAINRSTNVGNSLEGKVAGVNISPPTGGPGGSTKIRLRGQSSFNGDNSPLIVVNGIPINSSGVSAGGSNGNGTGNPTGGSSDQGDGLQSINQDDIESMTVLKGATAAALYGSSAKDGAIIITTKSGSKSKGIGVEYNLSMQAENALDYTNFQYIYGEGENGVRPASQADAQSMGVHSFGVKFDGAMVPQFDGSMHAYVPFKNRISAFYRTGTDITHSIALSGGSDKGSFRVSYTNMDADGIMPNSDYHKKILNLGLSYKLTDKLSTQVNANYSNEFNHNPPQIGIQDMDANTTIYTMANSIDPRWLKNYQDVNGNELSISRFTNRNNPYWVAIKRFENVNKDRIFGNASVRYQFFNWLYAQARIGQDYYTRPYNYDRPTGTRSIGAVSSGYNGYYYQDVSTYKQRNLDFLLGGNHSFGKFGVDVTLGGNQQKITGDDVSTSVTNFYVRDLYSIGNGQIKNPGYSYYQVRTNSFYGAGEISYKNFLYVNVTARKDWFSTLKPLTDSYLYPSISSSFIFSDALGASAPSWLNYGKLRLAYAEVGGGAPGAYSSNLYYSLNANPFNSSALGGYLGSTSPNPNLKPLAVKETELGIELRMFGSRVNLDLSVYNKNTDNQILNVNISNTSGFGTTTVNLGKLRNQGVEVLLTLLPVKSTNFTWETILNTSYNKSKVLQLANGQQRLDVGSGEFFGTVSEEIGQPLASLRSYDYKRDAQGRIITSGGLFQQGNLKTFGSAIPTWVGGWINTFTYKGIRFSTQIDYKAGATMLSNSNLNFLREGLSQQSLVGREGGVIFPGVNADGTPNTTAVPAEQFYTQYRGTGVATPFVYNASFVKWRSASIGYDFTKYVNKTFIKGLNVSAFVNNILIIKKFVDNLDPEAQVSASDNLQGIETHTLPTTRTFGLNVNIKL